jgi:sulfur carrier protein
VVRNADPFPCQPRVDLRQFAVMNIIVNGQSCQIDQNATVAALLEQLQLSGKPVAVEVNLELVPRQNHAERRLAEGDRLEIVTLVGGG